MLSLKEVAAALGGEVVGSQVLAPAPGHSRKDRGLSVRLSATAPDGFLVHSHNGHDWPQCRDHVRRSLGFEDWRPFQSRADDGLAAMHAMARRAEAAKADQADRQRRTDYAVKIWNEATTPVGTVVEVYLASRGLDLAADVAGTVLRFHPRGLWGAGRALMMVAAMHDVLTGELRAIHRTALTPAAAKIDRKMLGPAAGTATMLSKPNNTLVIGEGIETCLSAVQLGYGPGVWAMGSAQAIGRLPVMDRVERLILLEERDATSANAVSDCGHRWSRVGKSVSVVLPTTGKDLNDSLRGIA